MARLSNPISGYLESGRKAKQRDDALLANQKKNIQIAKELGMGESSMYRSGTLRKPQEELVSGAEQKAEESARAYYERAGLKESGQEKETINQIKLDRKIMEVAMHENTWQKAIQSLGYSQQETAKMLARFRQEEREKQAAYQNLMKTIAIVGVGAMTGGWGGAALAGVMESGDMTRTATGGEDESGGY